MTICDDTPNVFRFALDGWDEATWSASRPCIITRLNAAGWTDRQFMRLRALVSERFGHSGICVFEEDPATTWDDVVAMLTAAEATIR